MAVLKNPSQQSAVSGQPVAIANWDLLASWLEKCRLISQPSDFSDSRKILTARSGENVWKLLNDLPKSSAELGHLSYALPAPEFHAQCHDDWYWIPSGIPKGQSICVASSRLSQKLDGYDSWFDAIRTIAARLDPSEHFFVSADGTTTDKFIGRICELFGFHLVRLLPAPPNVTPEWFEGCVALANQQTEQGGTNSNCYCQFACDSDDQPQPKPNRNSPQIRNAKSIDEILISLATDVRLLSVRKNGNVERAALRRLKHPESNLQLLIDAKLTNAATQNSLIAAGATAWWLYHEPIQPMPETEQQPISLCADLNVHPIHCRFEAPILDISEIKPVQFLLHWTRRRVGPWPDQTQQEYVDDLIFRSSRRHHGEVSTVARILAARRIIATNQLTRDSQPVVCFSNLPINEISERKVFRKHLGRWDFLPFGLAINRQRLIQIGAREVIYGNERDWQKLAEADRPYFQLASTKDQSIDWRQEHEWRIVGDLNLEQVDVCDAFVFVRTPAEATAISSISRWPIVIMQPN